ncbi:MAG: DUF3604 domain-containing protein [Burkholderiaceae bacterium]|nr:DUF3604 domain-containing protein [Burkholderiaceae bacterium]
MPKPKLKSIVKAACLVFLAGGVAGLASAEQAGVGIANTADKARIENAFSKKPGYSPYAGRNFPTRPLFGDTHMHTGFSMDAGAFGARLTPRDAYRFARGEELASNSGQPVKLARPLDFLVVADHSDGMGFFPQLMSGDPALLATPQGRKWYDQIRGGQGAEATMDIIVSFGQGKMPNGFPLPGTTSYRNAWLETIKAAEAYNDPGRFTAFIGFEWTSNTGGNNLHRNVIFRGNGQQAQLVEPYTTLKPLGSDNPTDLWKWMAMAQDKTGSEVLAIAHNGNLSNGQMFPMVEAFGKKIDREYMEDARALGAPLRSHADQGHGRGAPGTVTQRRVRRLRTLGQGQPRRHGGEDEEHAAARVRTLGLEERPAARAGARRQPLQVRHDRQQRRAHRALRRWRRTTSSARPRRRNPARSA